jgi:small subunit ribosomal protein S21
MPGVVIRPGEPLEKMMRIFKKQVEKAGVIGDLKKRMHYEKPSIRLKKKSIAARKRRVKQMRKLGLAE